MPDYPLTEALREGLTKSGIRYTCGLHQGDNVVAKNWVTCAWIDDDVQHSVTFEELDDSLFCDDDITPEQAIALVLAGRSRS